MNWEVFEFPVGTTPQVQDSSSEICSFINSSVLSTNAQDRPSFICGHVATALAHPLQQASGVLADVREAGDDVVQVEVAEGGVVLTLPPHLEKKGRREVEEHP